VRIVVDATPLTVQRSGIGNYIRGAIGGLEEAGCEVVPFAVCSTSGRPVVQEALGDREIRFLQVPGANVVRRAWSAAKWPRLERLVGAFDGSFLSDWWYPPQASGVRATVVHDLVPLHFPQWVTRQTRLGHRLGYRALLPTCDVIFTSSQFSADDIAGTLGIDPERIVLAPPGIDKRFALDGAATDLGRPYALAVATREPRKNLGVLVEARRQMSGGPDIALVGGEGWGEALEGDAGLIELGYVDDDRLPELLRGAQCLVFPSLFEGFGMPIIEAMACGCPVVASSHPSLDEAAGDAAIRFDPHDPGSLVAALDRVAAESDGLRSRGFAHARRFTWLRAGEAMKQAYERVLSSR
jgi:glycosyltransferase involved in cell wall biosynthesis